jgi:hypothetical protein
VKSRVEALLATGLPEATAAELRIRYNASIATAKAYNEAPTTARERDWAAAKKDLEECVSELERSLGLAPETNPSDPSAPPDFFKKKTDVIDYLIAQGWDVPAKSSKVFAALGTTIVKRDGVFRRDEIDKYARVSFINKATGLKASDRSTILEEEKRKREIDRINEQTRGLKMDNDIKAGKYIARVDAELDLAARAAMVVAQNDKICQTLPARLAEAVGLDAAHIPTLHNLLRAELTGRMEAYVDAGEFEVTVE